MPSVAITRTTSIFPYGVFVQWSINSDESGAFLVTVSRSGSPEGPWTALAVNVENIFNYYDQWPTTTADAQTEDVSQLSMFRQIFYKIDVIPPSNTGTYSAVSPIEPLLSDRQRLIKRKMLRDQRLTYQYLNGTKIAILKRKHWGARCPDCFDSPSQGAVRAECTTCYGTTFTGGYYAPIYVRARRTVMQRQSALTLENTSDISVGQFWILDVPYVEVDDVVVTLLTGQRYKITKLNNTELQLVTVHQKFDVSELARSCIEYRIKVDPTNIPPLY